MTTFSSLGLIKPLLNALSLQGYRTPTPIQRQAIPPVLQGRDLLAAAQTGTGKTASFALPLLQRLSETQPAEPGVRALVLAPTRELAAQVGERIEAYSQELALRSTVVHGGVDMEPQKHELQRGVDVLIATPGRLLDLLFQGVLQLTRVEILVLDEADRMLDLGFIEPVRKILARLPRQRQNLLFSATFAPAVLELTDELLVDPVRVSVSPPNSAARSVRQSVYGVEWDDKPDTVRYLIQEGRWERALVFIRTKKSADDLAHYLQQEGVAAAAIHSNKSQHLRTKTLDGFKRGAIQVLVATDIAARGLDIAELPLVINYDLPRVAEDYVHRIGRSGRAGSAGRAISLLSGSERKWLAAIERLLNRTLAPEPLPFFENGVEQAVEMPLAKPKPSRSERQGSRNRATGNSAPQGKGKGKGAKPGASRDKPATDSKPSRSRTSAGNRGKSDGGKTPPAPAAKNNSRGSKRPAGGKRPSLFG